jgi:Tol biopolymer transport system component
LDQLPRSIMSICRKASLFTLLAAYAPAAKAQIMNAGGTRPAVSPDGRWVAFSSARDGTWDLYVVGVDGTKEQRLTNYAEKNFTALGPPTWIGDRVLATHRENDTMRVAVLDLPGSRSSSRAPSVSVLPDARQIRPSPDGRRLVFIHGDPRQPRVAVANIDGSGLVDLVGGIRGSLQPDWSRDGRQIAISALDSTSAGEVLVLSAAGGTPRVVAKFDSSEGAPIWTNWSPDGKRIAVQSGKYNPRKIEESTAQIWLIDVATGQATRVAPHTAIYLDETPAWFPDGSRIAFQSNRTGILQVWTMKSDGTDPQPLTSWTAKPPSSR